MDTIQRIRFPGNIDNSDLYVRLSNNSAADLCQKQAISMQKGDRASFNTYFNSFYEKHYSEYTNIKNIQYVLKLKGWFEIVVTREYPSSKKERLGTFATQELGVTDTFASPILTLNPAKKSGRIYIEIKCLSEKGIFYGGSLVTPEPPLRDVSIAIVICTYNRIASLKKVLENLFEDTGLEEKKAGVILVDNARQISKEDFPYERLKIFHNANAGGSGGFTRGIIESLESNEYTHLVLMDDDIALESESIYRLFGLYNHAAKEIAVAGQLLDLIRNCILYEGGAKYTFFRIIPRKHKLSLKKNDVLNSLQKEEDINYGGFWFFCVSLAVIEKVGLPLPLFKHFDDIEFGMRMKEIHKIQIVSFSGIAVWHKPFDIGRKDFENYYIVRNMLVINGIHRCQPYFFTVFVFTGYILLTMSKLCFNRSEMAIDAIADYLKGPEFIIKDQAALNTVILADFKKYAAMSFGEKLKYMLNYLKRWSILVFTSRTKWYRSAKEWNEFYKTAITKEFWKEYLSLGR